VEYEVKTVNQANHDWDGRLVVVVGRATYHYGHVEIELFIEQQLPERKRQICHIDPTNLIE
jgi:hypothetical protein